MQVNGIFSWSSQVSEIVADNRSKVDAEVQIQA